MLNASLFRINTAFNLIIKGTAVFHLRNTAYHQRVFSPRYRQKLITVRQQSCSIWFCLGGWQQKQVPRGNIKVSGFQPGFSKIPVLMLLGFLGLFYFLFSHLLKTVQALCDMKYTGCSEVIRYSIVSSNCSKYFGKKLL